MYNIYLNITDSQNGQFKLLKGAIKPMGFRSSLGWSNPAIWCDLEWFGNRKCPNLVSNEKNPGWFGYIGDYTIQLYRDYNKPW